MTQETAPTSNTSESFDPTALLSGTIDNSSFDRFRREAFQSLRRLDSLRDWLARPNARGVARGIVLWALGRHQEAVPLLSEQKNNATVATCLGQSYGVLGKIAEAEQVLTGRHSDPRHAIAWLSALEQAGLADRLQSELSKVKDVLFPADRKYIEGRVKELNHDHTGAIASYDEALGIDPQHRAAMFRLAVNVDLRGEDEEARELYERALMHPPVNSSCVMNLGVLYEDMGNYRRAMQCFDLALQAHPDNQRARLFRRDAAAALNMYYDEDQERRDDKRNKIMRTPINDFELSVRSRNCLAKMNIRTLGDLVRKTEAELLSYKNFGETSLTEIKEILRNKNLRLGMTADELMHRDMGETPEITEEVEDQPDPNSNDPLRRPVSELDLSVRSRRIVDLLKIRTVGDLANKTEAELLACPNFGQTSLNEIKTKLDERGLSLRG